MRKRTMTDGTGNIVEMHGVESSSLIYSAIIKASFVLYVVFFSADHSDVSRLSAAHVYLLCDKKL